MPTTEGIFLPFDEAIEFFRDKLTLSTERWDELQGAEHDHAFTTAGATSAQLLQEIRQQVDRAIADGISFGEFKKQFSEIADRLGWNHRGGRDWPLRSSSTRTLFIPTSRLPYVRCRLPLRRS